MIQFAKLDNRDDLFGIEVNYFGETTSQNEFYVGSFRIEKIKKGWMIRKEFVSLYSKNFQEASEEDYRDFLKSKLKEELRKFHLYFTDFSKDDLKQLLNPNCLECLIKLTPAKILHFHLDKKWFQAIQCRTKYYEIRPLMGRDGKEIINQYSPDYDYIRFYLGYPKKGDKEKIITREFKGYQVYSAQDRRFWRLLAPNEAEFLEKQYGFVNHLSGEPRDFIFLKANGENIDE